MTEESSAARQGTRYSGIQYTFLRAYSLRGIVLPAGESAVTLLVPSEGTIGARLVNESDASITELDRRTAVANMLLDGIFRGATGDPEERLQAAQQSSAQHRNDNHGPGPYLVLDWSGTAETFAPSREVETEDFIVALENEKDGRPPGVPSDQADAILAALAVTAPKLFAAREATEGLFYRAASGKPIYPFRLRGSASGYVSSPVDRATLQTVQLWFDRITRQRTFERVVRLLNASFQSPDDPLRAFMSAWSALEILVQKLFTDYERSFFQHLEDAERPAAQRAYIARVREVMRDKYRLADKFSLVASQLSPTTCDEDSAVFGAAKSQRDDLLHGQDINEQSLPSRAVQDLARRYLQMHLERV
jgi:hypothetical protein